MSAPLNAPSFLAVFDYTLPSKFALLAGGVALVLCLIGVAKFVVGRFSGLILGGVLWGLITAAVFYSGGGKYRDVIALGYGCVAFAAGSVFGLILARKPVEEDEEPLDPASLPDEEIREENDETNR